MRTAIDTILFDLDGTLTDSATGIVRSVRYALEGLGLESPPEDELRWCIGPPLHQNFARLMNGADAALMERAVGRYRERYDSVGYLENAVYEGVPEMLSELGRDRRLILVTAKMIDVAERVLDAFALRDHFTAVYGSQRDGRFADKRDLVAHVTQAHGLSSQTIALVGDREHDMIAARHHGIGAIGAGYGYGSFEELTAAGAHVICSHPREIVGAIASWTTAAD